MNTQRLIALLLVTVALASGCAMERGVNGGAAGELTSRPYFQVFEGEDGDHYFNLRAANHQIILQSQSYSARSGAINGVLGVLDAGERWNNYEVRESRDGQFYFVLDAVNGHTIGMSEMYTTRSNANRGVEAVQRNVGAYLDWQANRTGARYDVFRGADGRFYFNLHAANGEIVLSSQGYTTEESAYNGAFSVSNNGLYPEHYVLADSADGGAYFNLKAGNGRVIATSETYSSMSNAQRAVDAVIALVGQVDVL